MILDRAINASMESQTLSQEELGRFLKNLFLTGEDMETGQRTAERLSPVAAAHRILSNSFGLIPFGTYVKDGDARRAVHDPALDRLLKVLHHPQGPGERALLVRLQRGRLAAHLCPL